MELEIKNKQVQMNMKIYLKDCIINFPEEISIAAKTPATKSLIKVDNDLAPLCEQQNEIFHSIIQKLLYVTKRARIDLQVAIGFLCTLVRLPDKNDWKKLKRTLQYVYGTIDLKRILPISSFTDINIFVDVSHACHNNMRGQTGGCINMGYGVLHARSSKQPITSKSSTETELIGGSDYLSYALWYVYFFKEQGYVIENKTLLQDNESTIKLLNNGKRSSGKQTRHINISYFWITDRLKQEKINVK